LHAREEARSVGVSDLHGGDTALELELAASDLLDRPAAESLQVEVMAGVLDRRDVTGIT
jgi:hypothetical protein